MLTASIALAVYCVSMQRPAEPLEIAPAPQAENAPVGAAPPSEGIIALLANSNPRFELLDERGTRRKAELVQIDGDNVVLRSRDEIVSVPAGQLQRVDRRGDRPWDGALIGLGVGVGFWIMAASVDPGLGLDPKLDNPDDLTLGDTVAMVSFFTAVGLIVDTLHVGKHMVLVGPMRTNVSKPKAGLTLNVSGRSGERQLQVGYRVAF
jgi:hypothetical protein